MIKLTAQLVATYVGKNTLAIGELPEFIRSTYAALAGASSTVAEAAPARGQPAIAIRKSVTPDAIYCLECGAGQKMLKRHLASAHGLTIEEYRTKWSLAASYPMVAPDYAEKRSSMAKAAGLGHNRRKPKVKAKAELAPAPAEKLKRGRRKAAAE